MPKSKELYDKQKMGTEQPDYSEAEEAYRSDLLSQIQLAFATREQPHMEFNDQSYSQAYLKNRQQDMAYNPPKRNRSDTRLTSGIIHEKDNTILSILTSMNFQPRIKVTDKDDIEIPDAGIVLTAKVKKALRLIDFDAELEQHFRVNIAQGNVFVGVRREKRFEYKKVMKANGKWTTIKKEKDCGTVVERYKNTGVLLWNIEEPILKKQPAIAVVAHVHTDTVAAMFSDNPKWSSVPRDMTQTIPTYEDGVWGNFYLSQPQNKYAEVIIYQSTIRNEYNVFVNGVMMMPVQMENGLITGFPLTAISPSGEYTIAKGDNETIPDFAYGKSVPLKNEVKEEVLNELMRLMVYKMRQSAKPPVGNNSDKVLQANIWDPGVVTPDIKKDDLSILTPNNGITASDFEFYNLTNAEISSSSVSDSLSGENQKKMSVTQFVDQKKESLKKLGLSLDNAMNFLRQVYWLVLFEEITAMTKKKEVYDPSDNKFKEVYESFSIEDNIDGKSGNVRVQIVDEDSAIPSPQEIYEMEKNSATNERMFYVNGEKLKGILYNIKDKIKIDVISEPDGQEQAMLSTLFNIFTAYGNLKGDVNNINYDYLEEVIAKNSGFDETKLFKKNQPQQQQLPEAQGDMGLPGVSPDGGSQPRYSRAPASQKQRNPILENAT